jgi:cytoskeletal protein CcmA (bactofilin family)
MNVTSINGIKISMDDNKIIIEGIKSMKGAKDLEFTGSGTITGDFRGNINVTAPGVEIIIEGDMAGNIIGASSVQVRGDMAGNTIKY